MLRFTEEEFLERTANALAKRMLREQMAIPMEVYEKRKEKRLKQTKVAKKPSNKQKEVVKHEG